MREFTIEGVFWADEFDDYDGTDGLVTLDDRQEMVVIQPYGDFLVILGKNVVSLRMTYDEIRQLARALGEGRAKAKSEPESDIPF